MYIYIIMMGGSRRAQVCLAVLVVAVAHTAAQAGVLENLGGRTIQRQGETWVNVRGHTYQVDDDKHLWKGEATDYRGNENWRGAATQEGPRFWPGVTGGVEEKLASSPGEDQVSVNS